MSVPFLRSEDVYYCNLMMPRENAWDILNELGHLNALHFIDQDEYSRPFANFIKRCDETLARVQFIESELAKFHKPILKCPDINEFLIYLRNLMESRKKADHTYLEEVEGELEERCKQLVEQIKNFEDINNKKNYCLEYRAVLLKTKQILANSAFFKNAPVEQQHGFEEHKDFEKSTSDDDIKPITIGGIKINYLVGVIPSEDNARFKKMVFRISKGNVITHEKEIEEADLVIPNEEGMEKELIDPKNLQPVRKTVFLLIFTGGQMEMLKKKLIRICESFGVPRYDIPSNLTFFDEKISKVESDLKEIRSLVKLTESQLDSVLQKFSDFRNQYSNCSLIEELRLYLVKEKCIYQHMNHLRLENNVFIGNVWIPHEIYSKVQDSLNNVAKKNVHIASGQIQIAAAPENITPPTYFKTNDFTYVFQEIVNTYGMPRYKEINPGLFTIVSFPFLFGVMFGDVGHGSLLFLFSLYILISAARGKKGGLSALYPVRYLLVLMGFFAMYCGLIYNDWFSFPVNLFTSCYDFDGHEMIAKDQGNCAYAFGLDPVWDNASQDISYTNSLKMKLSVILGVIQMSMGVFMKGLNAVYFRKPEDFFFEFVPQILFMLLTFGYMDAMIFIKWSQVPSPKSPSLITTFMDMVLKIGAPPDDQDSLFDRDSQKLLQTVFLVIAVICIPLMLFPKPIYLLSKKKPVTYKVNEKSSGIEDKLKENLKKPLLDDKDQPDHSDLMSKINESEENRDEKNMELNKFLKEHRDVHSEGDKTGHEQEHGHDSGEIWVHQLIETIEFVLGSISNTASYLRLWALSLAHTQLAKVFFDKGIRMFIESKSFGTKTIGLIIGYFVFANITFAVLMCMDVMECFLHALRLHWVEFQNKFFKADGYKYSPYSFEKMLKDN